METACHDQESRIDVITVANSLRPKYVLGRWIHTSRKADQGGGVSDIDLKALQDKIKKLSIDANFQEKVIEKR